MSYSHEKLKATHTGKDYIPLTVEKEILAIRKDIERMSSIQSGPQLELIYQAYKEIKAALGQQAMVLDGACSGCIISMKKLLSNWFKKYDQKPVVEKVKIKPLTVSDKGGQELKPVDTPPTYGELLKRFKIEASDEQYLNINNGKQPNKSQLYEYFKIA